VEGAAHDVRSLPRDAYGRRKGSATVIRILVSAPVPLVCLRHANAAAEVMRKLTNFAAENAPNTLERSLPNIHRRYLHEPLRRCGDVLSTMWSIRGFTNPNGTAQGSETLTTVDAETIRQIRGKALEHDGSPACILRINPRRYRDRDNRQMEMWSRDWAQKSAWYSCSTTRDTAGSL
jgi:hypothetical protein